MACIAWVCAGEEGNQASKAGVEMVNRFIPLFQASLAALECDHFSYEPSSTGTVPCLNDEVNTFAVV